MSAEINSDQQATDSVNHQFDNAHVVAYPPGNGATDAGPKFPEEDVRSIIESIASTGAFWIEWDRLKNLLSFKLKQVLSEYPEGTMTIEQQNASLGETYQGLVHRLDEALIAFDEGPPFTLQRLCEILLSAQSIYPKLSKLTLALEKNLLVSSMLTGFVDSRSEMIVQGGDGPEEAADNNEQQSYPEQYGGGDIAVTDAEMETNSEETTQQSEIGTSPAAATTTETAPSRL